MSGLVMEKRELAQDDHYSMLLETPDRPSINFDLADSHGRRVLSIRVNGMTIASVLLDVDALGPMKRNKGFVRYCPYCGEEKDLFAARDRHNCYEN